MEPDSDVGRHTWREHWPGNRHAAARSLFASTLDQPPVQVCGDRDEL